MHRERFYSQKHFLAFTPRSALVIGFYVKEANHLHLYRHVTWSHQMMRQ